MGEGLPETEGVGVMPISEESMMLERSTPHSTYFVGWSEHHTRYRLFAVPLGAFNQTVRDEVGAAPTAVLVTLWFSGQGKSALFNAGGASALVDAYIGKKLEIAGADLAAVAPKLRALLVRP